MKDTIVVKQKPKPDKNLGLGAPLKKVIYFNKFLKNYFNGKVIKDAVSATETQMKIKALLAEIEATLISRESRELRIDNNVIRLADIFSVNEDDVAGGFYKDIFEYIDSDSGYCDSYLENSAISAAKLPYTCGIIECGQYHQYGKPTIDNEFLTLEAFFILAFLVYGLDVEVSYGQVQTTLIANNLPCFKLLSELIKTYLPASTEIHFTNPNTNNFLVTYIWV